jgi:hypothetical protein
LKLETRNWKRIAGVMAGMALASAIRAAEAFDWMPPASLETGLAAEPADGSPVPDIALTPTPKATADLAQYTREVVLDLKRFHIRNDGTEAEATSIGLNNALRDARTNGANRIVFPKGIYLISPTNPVIIDHQRTVIDLNGATLQIQSNGLPKYHIVEFVDGADGVRLYNGTLKGDRYSHDYKTVAGTHEWGTCLSFTGGRNLEVDHLRLIEGSGDGVSSGTTGARTRPELLARIKHSVYAKDLEPGAFSDTGAKVESRAKTRSIAPFDLSRCEGAFEFGYMAGYMGYPFIKGRGYQACFYDADMKFISRVRALQYRKVAVPEGARYLHLEFNQPAIADEPAHYGAAKGDWIARITNFRPATDVHFHHNEVSGNRRLGLAYCGGQRWLIESNHFAGNGGTAPAFGVDFEDGWELMQDVVFRNNTFKDNQAGDLVVCAGSELLFEGNVFEKSVSTAGRPHNYTFRNNRYTGGAVHYTTRTGTASIHDNLYSNCTLSITFDTKAVADGLYRPEGQTVVTPPLTLVDETLVDVGPLTGTYLCFRNSRLTRVKATAGKETRLIDFRNCELSDSALEYENGPTNILFRLNACRGDFREGGPGLGRKVGAAGR